MPAFVFFDQDTINIRKHKRIKSTLEKSDSVLLIVPLAPGLTTRHLSLQEARNFRFYRRTLDVDVLTIPFRIRPSVEGFPTQLNPNFSAALYLGRRIDSYHLKPKPQRQSGSFISGFGAGYGGFIGLGSATINPFVTRNTISYEYEGFVLTGGLAGIYDAKKFNLGVAIGSDLLMDQNRANWLYHKKIWFGVLFGINLN